VWFFFATLFYKTICVALLFLVWRKELTEKIPEPYRKPSIWAIWLCLAVTLWIVLPRYRINSGDSVRLLYVDKEGYTQHPPIYHWLLSMLPPEEAHGYKIDASQIHLMGLSNGGSPIVAAMHSNHDKDFKSITTITCNLESLRRVPCQVNLIGGGQDNSSKGMPSQYRKLKRMNVDAALYFDEDENHYIMVNQREQILDFLKKRINFQLAEYTTDDDILPRRRSMQRSTYWAFHFVYVLPFEGFFPQIQHGDA